MAIISDMFDGVWDMLQKLWGTNWESHPQTTQPEDNYYPNRKTITIRVYKGFAFESETALKK